jgi:hypothetical protein
MEGGFGGKVNELAREKLMKTRLFLVGAALALGLGSGCATYTGGTADEDGVVYGSEYVNPHQDYFGARAVPVWKQPSPSGHELGGTRPEIIWYR